MNTSDTRPPWRSVLTHRQCISCGDLFTVKPETTGWVCPDCDGARDRQITLSQSRLPV